MINNKKGQGEIIIALVFLVIVVIFDIYISQLSDITFWIDVGFWGIFGVVYLFWTKGIYKLFLGVFPLLLAGALFGVPILSDYLMPDGIVSLRVGVIVLIVIFAVLFAHKVVEDGERGRIARMR